MKAKKFIALCGIAIAAMALALSCQKSHYCLCVSDKPVSYAQDTMIVNVDNSMNCKRIQQLGILKQNEGELEVDSVYSFTCTKLHKDSLANYRNLHLQ
ncbi:MAG: hypothetical protein HUK17_01045 [Bacteroidales bacterium]|nr:hypothetical protein [Bacteroidales bacterium]